MAPSFLFHLPTHHSTIPFNKQTAAQRFSLDSPRRSNSNSPYSRPCRRISYSLFLSFRPLAFFYLKHLESELHHSERLFDCNSRGYGDIASSLRPERDSPLPDHCINLRPYSIQGLILLVFARHLNHSVRLLAPFFTRGVKYTADGRFIWTSLAAIPPSPYRSYYPQANIRCLDLNRTTTLKGLQ